MIPNKSRAEKHGVLEAVARKLSIDVQDITDKNREAWRVIIRYAIARALREDNHWPWPEVGSTIGKERTTTYYAVDIAARMRQYGSVEQKAIIERVTEAVNEYLNSLSTNHRNG
jgi:chromosomal replication initiation ATPase DnaA